MFKYYIKTHTNEEHFISSQEKLDILDILAKSLYSEYTTIGSITLRSDSIKTVREIKENIYFCYECEGVFEFTVVNHPHNWKTPTYCPLCGTADDLHIITNDDLVKGINRENFRNRKK